MVLPKLFGKFAKILTLYLKEMEVVCKNFAKAYFAKVFWQILDYLAKTKLNTNNHFRTRDAWFLSSRRSAWYTQLMKTGVEVATKHDKI